MLSRAMERKLRAILADDVGGSDITSALLPSKECSAKVIAREPCTIAGLEEAKFLFNSEGAKATSAFRDGARVRKDAIVLRLRGPNRKIFLVERTALNVIGRMSEVATTCAEAKRIAGKRVTVALTRKTVPGFNLFDKKAARVAGVWPHRINLNSFVLLKDNHLPFFGSACEAVMAAKKRFGRKKIVEVEAESLQQALDAARARPAIIMLDNFSPKSAASTVKKLRLVFGGRIELSGGINLGNLKQYAAARPDIISMGCLTYATKWRDFSLKLGK